MASILFVDGMYGIILGDDEEISGRSIRTTNIVESCRTIAHMCASCASWQYGAESWAGLLFLSCVAAALLIPAVWFSHKV